MKKVLLLLSVLIFVGCGCGSLVVVGESAVSGPVLVAGPLWDVVRDFPWAGSSTNVVASPRLAEQMPQRGVGK